MLAAFTAVASMLWVSVVAMMLLAMPGESKQGLRLLERLYLKFRWRTAARRARTRLAVFGPDLTWQARSRALRELVLWQAAFFDAMVKFIVLMVPAAVLVLTGAAYVDGRFGEEWWKGILGSCVAVLVMGLSIGVMLLQAQAATGRATRCFVVQAAVQAGMSVSRRRRPRGHVVDWFQAASSLETLARNLEIYGTKRIKPDGRNPIGGLVSATDRAAAHVRALGERLFLNGGDVRDDTMKQLTTLLDAFLMGRYKDLAPQGEGGREEGTAERRGNRMLTVLTFVSAVVVVMVSGLTLAGLPGEVAVASVALLLPAWWAFLRLPGQPGQGP